MKSFNHVCEDCGHEWESATEDENCPACGSGDTEGYEAG